MRGDVWWADVEGVKPVVVLSGDEPGEIRAMFIVEPARADIEGVCLELPVGQAEGLSDPGAVRVALPSAVAFPCSWLVTLRKEDLTRRAGALSSAKLEELGRMMALAGLE